MFLTRILLFGHLRKLNKIGFYARRTIKEKNHTTSTWLLALKPINCQFNTWCFLNVLIFFFFSIREQRCLKMVAQSTWNLLNSIVTAFYMFQNTAVVLILGKNNPICSKHYRIPLHVPLANHLPPPAPPVLQPLLLTLISAVEITLSKMFLTLSLFTHTQLGKKMQIKPYQHCIFLWEKILNL